MRILEEIARVIATFVLALAGLGSIGAIFFFMSYAERHEGGGTYAIAAAILIGLLWLALAVFLRPHFRSPPST